MLLAARIIETAEGLEAGLSVEDISHRPRLKRLLKVKVESVAVMPRNSADFTIYLLRSLAMRRSPNGLSRKTSGLNYGPGDQRLAQGRLRSGFAASGGAIRE
jgi:hypothetical protein